MGIGLIVACQVTKSVKRQLMSDAFISYSRRGIDFVRHLFDQFLVIVKPRQTGRIDHPSHYRVFQYPPVMEVLCENERAFSIYSIRWSQA